MATKISKPGEAKATVQHLNTLVSSELSLFLTTWNIHWNITGPNFHSLHVMLEEQYNTLKDQIDEVAERVRMLGGVAETKVNVKQTDEVSWERSLKNLLSENENIAGQILDKYIPAFEKVGDDGTVDLLTGLLQIHEKHAWMLRATLDK